MTVMTVRKRNGDTEPVDVNKIVRAVQRWADDLRDVDPLRVATKTISGLYDGATTTELDQLSIRTAAEMIGEEPEYSRLAARLPAAYVEKEVRGQGVASFSQSVALGHAEGLIGDGTAAFVKDNARKLDFAVAEAGDRRFEYFGLRTVYDRYLLRHPASRLVLETPQYFLLRVACGLSRTPAEAIGFYRLMSSLAYLPSSPTLFNAGTRHTQLSSCYLVDSPRDELDSIYSRYAQVAKLSKFAGGIGLAFSRVRSRGALIRGTNGASNGIVPFLRTLDASVAAVNQGGRRKGAACVYLKPWHPDVEEFLELRDNTGEDARRTHNLNLANWVPDEFLRRVEADGTWLLMDPDTVPGLTDLWGAEFDAAYRAAEGRIVRQVRARDLYGRMMRTLAQTGNGWLTFKDPCNARCNQTGPGRTVHLSNLCTEILEVSSDTETAVCNLGSVNLARHLVDGGLDWEKLRQTVRTAVPFLDRVIDINYYPSTEAAASNPRWRPVGLGVMGLQDVFFALRLPFDSDAARELSTRIAEEVHLTALETSAGLAEQHGAHPGFADTRAAAGDLDSAADRRAFLLNLICFAACIEGLFFYGAFAYVYFLRSRGLLNGLASGTNWVFRDESMHMAFAFDVVETVRAEEPELFDDDLAASVRDMLAEAVECEVAFAEDLLGQGVSGVSIVDMRAYLQHVADRRLAQLGMPALYGSANPFAFMELQDVQELSNFFERRVSAYQIGVAGSVSFDDDF